MTIVVVLTTSTYAYFCVSVNVKISMIVKLLIKMDIMFN